MHMQSSSKKVDLCTKRPIRLYFKQEMIGLMVKAFFNYVWHITLSKQESGAISVCID